MQISSPATPWCWDRGGRGDRNSSVNTTTAGWRKRYLSSQRPNTMSGESKYVRQPPFFTALCRSWVVACSLGRWVKGQESPQTLFRVPYFPWSLCVDPPVSVTSCHGSRVTKCPHITHHTPAPGTKINQTIFQHVGSLLQSALGSD